MAEQATEPSSTVGYDALVLAGGAGHRLGGADKAGLQVGGSALLDRVLAAVADAQTVVVVGPRRDTARPVRWTREEPPGGGPVAALRAGLGHVRSTQVAVLATDLPFLSPAQVAALVQAAEQGDGALLVDDNGREQYLAGVWRANALRETLRCYDGSSMRGLLVTLRYARVAVRVDRVPPWYDVDTQDDLDRARRWAMDPLQEWTKAAVAALGLPAEPDRDAVLDLARDVAHNVARPAAPLTTYLAGLAVGAGQDRSDVIARLIALAQGWAATQ